MPDAHRVVLLRVSVHSVAQLLFTCVLPRLLPLGAASAVTAGSLTNGRHGGFLMANLHVRFWPLCRRGNVDSLQPCTSGLLPSFTRSNVEMTQGRERAPEITRR